MIDPAVRAVMAKINKKHGHGTVMVGSDIQQKFLPKIPSGSLSLDVALGGGWVTNQFVEVVGSPSAGKTFLVLKTVAANQKRDPNWVCVWFAAEDFVESYAEMLGCDIDRMLIVNENIMEDVYDQFCWFLETRSVDCVVIDSLPALIPGREFDADFGEYQPGLPARTTNAFFRKASGLIKRSLHEDGRSIVGIIINQWRNKFTSYGDPRTTPGGMGKDFACFQQVEVRRDEWINNSKGEHVGQVMKVVNRKNKVAPPGRIGMVDAYFRDFRTHKAGDYDSTKDYFNAGLAYDVIKQSGAFYMFDDSKWQGKEKAMVALGADPKLRGRLRRAVLASTTGVESTNGVHRNDKTVAPGEAGTKALPAAGARKRSATSQGRPSASKAGAASTKAAGK